MNYTFKSIRCISFALCFTLIMTCVVFFPDRSYAKTEPLAGEKAELSKKIDKPKKGADYKGYIVSIKDSKIDAVSNTEVAENMTSSESEKYYLIETTKEAISLASASAIEYVEPNYKAYAQAWTPPDDPDYLDYLTYGSGSGSFTVPGPEKVYASMGIPTLWENGLRGSGVTLAILDTGIMAHDDMVAPNDILISPDDRDGSVSSSTINNDVEGHGTMTTSLIRAGYNNNKNIAGIADQVDLISINVFTEDDGEVYATTWQTMNAYEYLLLNDIPGVMNCSYGGPAPTVTEANLLNQLTNAGCIVIAANGNDGANTDSTRNQLSYPADYPSVIGVGATDGNGNITGFSSKNSSVEVSAWGDYVAVLDPEDVRYTVADSGTSFSSPITAGIVACLKEKYPLLTTAHLRDVLKYSSTDKGAAGWDSSYGYGIINASQIFYMLKYGLATVKYNDRGNVTTKGYYITEKLTNMPVPVRSGYTFLGWYTSSTGGTKASTATEVKSNMTLYARWAAKSYKVTFNVNKGKSIKTKSKTVTYDKSMGSLPTPSRKGYNFYGWKSKKTGGTVFTSTRTWQYTENKTLYANWTKSHILKYNANGGHISHYAKTIKKGSKIGHLYSPTRTGYKFKGWYTKSSGGSKVTSSTKIKSSKNYTVYAHWTKI